MSLRILGRGLLVLLLDAVALLLLSELLAGFVLDGAAAALGAAAAIGLLNALVWPVLARVALPLTVLTLGARGAAAQRDPRHLRDQPDPRAPTSTASSRGSWSRSAISAADRDLLLAAGDRRGRHLVPERRRPPGAAPAGSSVDTEVPGIVFLEIDGLAHDVLRRAIADGSAPHLGRLAAGRLAPARALGDRLVLADRRLPGRAPARRQRRHAGLPLVGEGPRHRDRHQPPPRRRGARAPPLRRARAAPRRRRQPRQHPLRRRAALDADDEHRADPPPADRARLLRLLRPPLRGRPHPRAGARRHRPRAPRRPQPGPRRRPAADRPAALLRPGQGLGDDRPARPPGRHRGRRHPRRPAGRSTRPSSPTTRSPTTRGSNATTPSPSSATSTARSPGSRRRRARRPVPTGSSSSPTTASRRAKPSSIATANRSRTWSGPPATPRA